VFFIYRKIGLSLEPNTATGDPGESTSTSGHHPLLNFSWKLIQVNTICIYILRTFTTPQILRYLHILFALHPIIFTCVRVHCTVYYHCWVVFSLHDIQTVVVNILQWDMQDWVKAFCCDTIPPPSSSIQPLLPPLLILPFNLLSLSPPPPLASSPNVGTGGTG
jgi:hypothetical protein